MAQRKDCALAVLDGGYRQTRLAVYSGNQAAFQHSQPFGCVELAERLRVSFGLSPDDTPGAVADCASPGGSVSRIRESFLRDLARHTARALQLYPASRPDIRAPEKMLVWGGAALVHGTCDVLQETLGMPVSVADPLLKHLASPKMPKFSPVLLGACALALNDHA